ncbi:MAG TPA: TonB-dependent receptor [Pyrinomonadaceae bacterium]|nr:TonB-dependent receptor [Pyrinomonadaceae bacterium]
MRKYMLRMLALSALAVIFQSAAIAQITGSIAGTVVDANGAAVPSATVTITSASGQEFKVQTNDAGAYRVPALGAGYYKVEVAADGFKRSLVERVKVDVGTPTTVNVAIQTGDISETVTVTGAGGEVLQTQTATIGTTLTGRQILETPVASRDALDLVALLPGTASVGAPRRSSINGLPKGSLSITIDGVDVQDNLLRSSDGYFTYVRPRLDAIEEVTVSTSNPGSEGGGDGAVQIKFVTRRGNNDYKGSVFWQHRDEGLNANYWYQNRDGQRDDNGKAYRQKIRLNQFGGSFSGPIPFFSFGGDSWFDSGKDKRFFFVNYEEFRLPASQARTRTVFTPDAQAGIYRYIVGTETRQVNLYQIAANAGQISTPDPTVADILARIRSAVGTEGTLTPISNSPNYLNYNFSPSGDATRKFLALRFDFNINKSNSVEFVTNQQEFVPSKDFLNSQDERFPGFPWYTQGSVRDSYSVAVRSNFLTNVVNEARFAMSTGLSTFSAGISAADYDYSRGFQLGLDAAGITTPYSRNSYSDRNTPTYDFTNNVTWIRGNHTIGFGGQWKLIRREGSAIGRIVPTISFGLDSTDAAFNIFSATTLPGATAAQLTTARAIYATLVGRVTAYTSTAYLTSDGTYQENSLQSRLAKQNTWGLYVQDSWRINKNFTLNYGLRWQPQSGFVALSEGLYTRLEKHDQIYGISGPGNIFKPGTLTGSEPRVVPLLKGEKAYPDDLNNFAPSIGVVWSPDFSGNGFTKSLFGSNGKSVFRGGYSMAFVREGFDLLESIYGANPGGTQSLSRTIANGLITVGTNLRTGGNPNLTPAPGIVGTKPSFPIALTVSNSTNSFDPNLKTGAVHSFSFGYQRELDRNTVVEIRYVGNRGVNLQRQYNINEFNTIENGFADEFRRAQDNLYANIAAGRGQTFAYFGPGTGTSPLPIMMAYFNTPATFDPSNPARYTAANFANTTLVAALSRNFPTILTFNGTNFENNAARRANAIANGLPVNFFYVNPTTGVNGSFTVDNSNKTWYDSGVIELRRRLSNGLRVQASYVFSKAMANAYASSSVVFAGFSQRPGGLDLARNVQAFDLTHNFKFDATYDLPFGRGRSYLGNTHWFVDGIIGGWTILPTIRWQSGSPFSLGNVQLVGMTKKELQKAIGVYKNSVISGVQVVTYLPEDIIVNTQRAFNISVANTTTNNGYGTTFGSGGPQGRFIAPAGFGNCISRYVGECGFNNLIMYGPSFFKVDATLAKRFRWGEKRSVEFRVTALDALNAPNFRVGGFGADVIGVAVGGATFAQMGNGSAYQDVSTTNDLGGRQIDIMFRINF